MKVLSFQERIDFVNEVVEMCTVNDDYQPALFEAAFRLTCLKYFVGYDYRSEPQTEWPRIAYDSFNLKIETAGCDTAVFWDQYDSLERQYRSVCVVHTMSIWLWQSATSVMRLPSL